MYGGVHVEARSPSGVFSPSNHSPSHFLIRVSHWSWSLLIQLDRLASVPQECSASSSSTLGLHTHHHTRISVWVPGIWTLVCALPTWPSPPFFSFFFSPFVSFIFIFHLFVFFQRITLRVVVGSQEPKQVLYPLRLACRPKNTTFNLTYKLSVCLPIIYLLLLSFKREVYWFTNG